MQENHQLRLVARAIDELKRGYAVLLEGVAVRAAEVARAENQALVLTASRASYLKVNENNDAVTIESIGAEHTLVALYGKTLPALLPVRKANGLELSALNLIRETGFLPAALVGGVAEAGAISLSQADVQKYAETPKQLVRLPEARLPIHASEHTTIIPFRERGGATHLAVVIGTPLAMDAPLVRLHSSCLTGDLLGSLRCDCGDQLKLALETIAQGGGGVLLYLDQEGRGIGLANKLRAYQLQDNGMDTVDANHVLGFSGDERDFSLGARMLQALSIQTIKLLTNNPAKAAVLRACGINVVEQLPLRPNPTAHNEYYLATKRSRLGHVD